MSRTILQVIPYDGIGGVETAARSIPAGKHRNLQFDKTFIFPVSTINITLREQLFFFIKAIQNIIELRPDVLVGSLWRSYLVLIIVKLLRPKTCLVTFLHLPSSVHLLDLLFSFFSMLLSRQIWVDSRATLEGRVPPFLAARAKVISFLVSRVNPLPFEKVRPNFIFWGRLHRQKGLGRAIRLFAKIKRSLPRAQFYIIGPDCGVRSELEELVRTLHLCNNVWFVGPMKFDGIIEIAGGCSFFIQSSVQEGMAISVVEAMQLGLVPLVTRVGELIYYCDDSNSINIDPEDNALLQLYRLLSDEEKYFALSTRSSAYWNNQELYSESFLNACSDLNV